MIYLTVRTERMVFLSWVLTDLLQLSGRFARLIGERGRGKGGMGTAHWRFSERPLFLFEVFVVEVDYYCVYYFIDHLQIFVCYVFQCLLVFCHQSLDPHDEDLINQCNLRYSLLNLKTLSQSFIRVIKGEELDTFPFIKLLFKHLTRDIFANIRLFKSTNKNAEEFPNQVNLFMRLLNSWKLFQSPHIESIEGWSHFLFASWTSLKLFYYSLVFESDHSVGTRVFRGDWSICGHWHAY